MLRFLLLFTIFISYLFASPNITIDKKDIYNNFEVFYIKDKTSKLNIDDISKIKFEKTIPNAFSLGYIKDTAWLKFSIENKSQNNEFILSLNESFYEIANLYYYDKKWIKESNGIFKSIKTRDIKTNHLAFNLDLKLNEKKIFYLELKAKYAYFGNLELYEKSHFYFDNNIGINTLYLFIFGIVSIILLFNLLLYIKTKEKLYIYYVGYNFFAILYLLNISGLLGYINLQEYIYKLHLSASFMFGFLILFSYEYLEIKKYFTKYHKLVQFLAIPSFIFGILVLFSFQPWNKYISNFAALTCIILIVISTTIYFKSQSKTKYYIFAMIQYFTFVVLFVLMAKGTIEYNNFTRYGFVVGSAIEVIIFAFLLANRFNETKEKIQYYLEDEVKKRTNKLTLLIDERELLLKEVHHRVKNNFHMVIGMLWFESKKENSDAKSYKELINRIKSMSMIHEDLYNSKDLTNINLKSYLEKIIYNITSSYKNSIINSSIDDMKIGFDDAISLGMIINELFTNSIKHNCNIDNFYINLDVTQKNNQAYLIIKDNGIGFDIKNTTKSLGLKLIEQFSKKLPNSEFSFSYDNGTKFEIVFNIGVKNEK